MTDIVAAQKERIDSLEKLISEQSKEINRLLDINRDISQVLHYLTDPEFRDFCFKLNYNELIARFLENESNGQEWV